MLLHIRHEEKVLLLQRADVVSVVPGAWDGVYGVGDSNDLDVVTSRIEEATGIPHESLIFVRSGDARGLEFGNRLNDVTPLLFLCDTEEVTAKGLYKSYNWVDRVTSWVARRF